MSLARAAIAAAKPGDGNAKPPRPEKRFDQMALVTVGNRKGGHVVGLGRQTVDMPMHSLRRFQVPAQSGIDAAGPVGASRVDIATGTDRLRRPIDRLQIDDARQVQRKQVGAGPTAHLAEPVRRDQEGTKPVGEKLRLQALDELRHVGMK